MRLVFKFFSGSNDFIVQKVYLLRLMPVYVDLTLSHIAYFVLFISWPRVQLDEEDIWAMEDYSDYVIGFNQSLAMW